jgi:sugar lactone lactonase YvrE
MKRIWLFLPLVLLACDQRTSVLIDIQGPRAVSTLELSVKLPGRERRQTLSPPSLTPPVSVLVLLPDVAQTVDLTLIGTEDGGRPVSSVKSVLSVPRQQVFVTMPLYGEGDDMSMPDDLAGADLTGYVEDLASSDLTGVIQSDGGSGDMAGVIPTLKILGGIPGGHGWYDGTGRDARLAVPQQPALVGTSLYLFEEFSGRLRKVDVTNGAVTTVPLTRESDGMPYYAYGPMGLVSDGAGHLYVAASYDHTIRRVTLADGKVNIVAGTESTSGSTDSPALFETPRGLAIDVANNDLYVADSDNNLIRKIALGGPTVTTVAGAVKQATHQDGSGSSARFVYPRGLSFLQDNLYVTDGGSLRQVNLSVSPAPVTTIIQPGAAWQTGTGVAAAVGGVFYVIDQPLNNLRRVTGTNTESVVAGLDNFFAQFLDGVGTAARFADPRWIVLDGAGQAYITEGAAVRKVSLADFNVTTLAGMSPQWGWVDSPDPNPRFDTPAGMAFDGTDTLYIADFGNHRIRTMKLSTGEVKTFAGSGNHLSMDGTGQGAGFGRPSALTFDNSGNLYVADFGGSCIRKVTVPAAVTTTIAGHCNEVGPPSPSPTPIPGANAYFSTPFGMVYDGDHTLFVADSGNNVIRGIDISGPPYTVTHVAGSGVSSVVDGVGTAASFSVPHGIAWDAAAQRLYVGEFSSGVVRQIDLVNRNAANVTKLSGVPYASYHAEGNLGSATFGALFGLSFDPVRRFLYVGDADRQLVRRIDLDAQQVSSVVGTYNVGVTKAGPLPAWVHTPKGLLWIPQHGLVISSWDEHTILLATGL